MNSGKLKVEEGGLPYTVSLIAETYMDNGH